MASLTDYLVRLLPNKYVKREYLKSGARYAYWSSYLMNSADPIQGREFERKFEFWQKEYVRRGFQPVSMDQLELATSESKLQEILKRI